MRAAEAEAEARAESLPACDPAILPPSGPPRGARAGFSLRVEQDVIPLHTMAVSALPNEPMALAIEAWPEDTTERVAEACATAGRLTPREGLASWMWHPPAEPGRYTIRVSLPEGGQAIRLVAFVLVPYDGERVLSRFEIGDYERVPLRDHPAYGMPRGLIEVTPDLADIPLSPHFRLRSFLSKQTSQWPRYALVDTRLLLKLEYLLDRVRAEGLSVGTFAILSGYRTPAYNAAIGNQTRYSRHLYGDAADIYVDEDGDGRMDDLDGDGAITKEDARRMAEIVERALGKPGGAPFVGGLGIYGPAPHRGPFIHVDTRGFRARW